MKPALGRYVAAAAVILVGIGSGFGLVPAAAGGSAPPWEPDPQAVGGITFYNDSGAVITSGSVNAKPFAAFAVGSTAIHSGDRTAALIAAQPNAAAGTANWNSDFLSGFTAYPITSGPGAVQTLSKTRPVVSGAASDLSLADFIAEFPSNSAKAGYKNVYQLRLKTASGADQTTQYDVADVAVSGNTWTEVYPAGGTGPVKTPKPKIKGKVRVGSKVTCVSSAGAPYAWQLNGSKAASGKKYKIPASAYKAHLTCTAGGKTSKARKVGKRS